MTAVTDITKLVQGQKLIRVLHGEVHYYEFLMIHPHNPEYIFCMNFCKRAERFYKSEKASPNGANRKKMSLLLN